MQQFIQKWLKPSPKVLLLVVVIVVLIIGGWAYLRYNKWHPSTNDAYVNAHIINIAAQVSGKVESIAVQDHQQVEKSQLLFVIDPSQYQYDLVKTQADYAAAESQMRQYQDTILKLQAELKKAQANETVVDKESQRTLTLVEQKLASSQSGDEALANIQIAAAETQAAKEALAESQEMQRVQKAQMQAKQALVNQAQLNLQWTKVYAPTTGVISNFSLRTGDYVSVGVNLFALVDTNDWWVDANYKETELQRIKVGQKAQIELDMYPSVTFQGVVQSISAGSGVTFSLLPPENATGNWVKVSQRFPVKINIPQQSLKPNYPLRVGATADVRIDT